VDLSEIATCELVKELRKREGVDSITVDPYEEFKIIVGDKEIADTGPVIILTICD